MKFNRKILFTYIFFILFAFSSKSLLAQRSGMGALNARIDRQFENQQMQLQMQMNALRGAGYSYNEKYTFIVTMTDGSKKEVSSKIYTDTTCNKNYLLLIDK